MSVKVVPLAVTKVDWANVAQFAQSTFGFFSMNESDETVRFINLLKNAEGRKDPLQHLYLTVGIDGNQSILNYLHEFRAFDVWSTIREESLTIICSGSFRVWKDAIEFNCNKESNFKIRILFNNIFLIFERGCPEAVKEWHKVGLPDNSFVIQRRM